MTNWIEARRTCLSLRVCPTLPRRLPAASPSCHYYYFREYINKHCSEEQTLKASPNRRVWSERKNALKNTQYIHRERGTDGK